MSIHTAYVYCFVFVCAIVKYDSDVNCNACMHDHLNQLVMADFYGKELEKITVEQVASATSFWMEKLFVQLTKTRFYLIEKMLERFDLVKKEKK